MQVDVQTPSVPGEGSARAEEELMDTWDVIRLLAVLGLLVFLVWFISDR